MNNFKFIYFEERFLHEVKKYVNIYEFLMKNGKQKEAYSFALCFYASLLGVLYTVHSKNKYVTSMLLMGLSIDLNIIYDLNEYMFSDEQCECKEYNSINYCYNKAQNIKFERTEYVVDKLLELHKRIAICSKIDKNENVKIQKTKELIYSKKSY